MVNKSFLTIFFLSLLIVVIIFAFGINPFNKNVDTKKNAILLGASLPLSGMNSNIGHDIVKGANAYFSHTNAKGGINGRKIEFIRYDDQYEPEETLKNTKKLIQEDNVFALFGFVGTPTVKKVLPLIIQNNIPFIAPYTGASFLRNGATKNIVINFRSSYIEEIESLVEHLSKIRDVQKFAIFYQNDAYGEEGYIALKQALTKRGLTLAAQGTYKRNTLSIQQAIREIQSAKPEAIILIGAYKPTALFIEKARESSLKNAIFCPISFVSADALMNELRGDGKNILFSQTVPSYNDFLSSEETEYAKLLKFYYPEAKPSLISFESYLAAKAVVSGLKTINETITRENFIESLKEIDENTLDKISLSYHNSQLLNQVYLSIYHDKKFHIIDKYKY